MFWKSVVAAEVPRFGLALGLFVAATLLGPVLVDPPSAAAQPTLTQEETTFLTKLAKGDPSHNVAPVVPAPGGSSWDLAQLGRMIADDVRHGVHPLDEQSAIERTYGSARLTSKQWSLVVVAAVSAFAPDFARWYWDCGTGPICGDTTWPPGASMTPWQTPGFRPFVDKTDGSWR